MTLIVKWTVEVGTSVSPRESRVTNLEDAEQFIAGAKKFGYIKNIHVVERTDMLVKEYGDGEQEYEDW